MCQPFATAGKRDVLKGAGVIVNSAKLNEGLTARARACHTSSALADMDPHWKADAALRWATDAAREAVKAGVMQPHDRTPQAILAAAIVMLSTRSEYVK